MAPSLAEIKHVNYLDRVYASMAELARRDAGSALPCDLRLAELRIFSQNGEDGVLDALVRILEPPRHFVEFGVGDGWSCNTRLLAEVREWEGLYIEVDPSDFNDLAHRYRFSETVACLNSAVTPDNVSETFQRFNVPSRFGVLSIDIDGQDFWVWRALSDEYRPDIVVIEFNAEHQPGLSIVESQTMGRHPSLGREWGASLSAVTELANSKGYVLVHVEMARVNAFFVAEEALHPFVGQICGRTSQGAPNYGLHGRGLSDEVAFPVADRTERQTEIVDSSADR